MTSRNFSLQKENDCEVQLRFVKCCTLVVTEGQISHMPFYYLQDVYHKNKLGT